MVTPHAGVWIETAQTSTEKPAETVTPHAGVWIETNIGFIFPPVLYVTPHAGVWIETSYLRQPVASPYGHASCRRVD